MAREETEGVDTLADTCPTRRATGSTSRREEVIICMRIIRRVE